MFFWLVVLVAVIWFLTSERGCNWRAKIKKNEAPTAVIRQRYARGEIDAETMWQMLADIEKSK